MINTSLSPKSVAPNSEIMYADYSTFLADAIHVHDATRIKSSHTFDYQFSGTKTFSDAVMLATHGWNYGANMAANMAANITSKVSAHLVESTIYLDTTTNYCWDMASAVAGVPQCGVNFQQEPERKTLKLQVMLGASSIVSAETLVAKAATVAALVAALEHSGIGVEVICSARGSNDIRGIAYQVGFILKQASETLDLNILAFAVGHPAFRRRIQFNWMEQYFNVPLHSAIVAGGSYGSPKEIYNHGADIYIPRASGSDIQWTNPDVATAWILGNLKEQGVALV